MPKRRVKNTKKNKKTKKTFKIYSFSELAFLFVTRLLRCPEVHCYPPKKKQVPPEALPVIPVGKK